MFQKFVNVSEAKILVEIIRRLANGVKKDVSKKHIVNAEQLQQHASKLALTKLALQRVAQRGARRRVDRGPRRSGGHTH